MHKRNRCCIITRAEVSEARIQLCWYCRGKTEFCVVLQFGTQINSDEYIFREKLSGGDSWFFLSFALVYPFQLSLHVWVFGRHSVNCAAVVAQHSVHCARVVRHIRCLFSRSLVVASAHLVHGTVCSWLETKKISCVHLIPHVTATVLTIVMYLSLEVTQCSHDTVVT